MSFSVFTTEDMILAASAEKERELTFAQSDHDAALRIFRNMSKDLGFCWRYLRGRNGSINFEGMDISVTTSAKRTTVEFYVDSKCYIHFRGADDGISVSPHAIHVRTLSALHSFAEFVKKFSSQCSKSTFK